MSFLEERVDALERKCSELESCHITESDRVHEMISAQVQLQAEIVEVLTQLKKRLDTLEGK